MKKLKKMQSPCSKCEAKEKCKLTSETCLEFYEWAIKSWKELRKFFMQFKEE